MDDNFFTRNVTKPSDKPTTLTYVITHPSYGSVYLAAVTDGKTLNTNEDAYTFGGIKYTPVAMTISYTEENDTENGGVTISFARAGLEVKKKMRSMARSNVLEPTIIVEQIWSHGIDTPEETEAYMDNEYPRVSKDDVSIKMSRPNPALDTVGAYYIARDDNFKELQYV